MTEKYLFRLPQSMEGVIGAISVLQDFIKYKDYVFKKDYKVHVYEMHVCLPDKNLSYLMPAISDHLVVWLGTESKPPRGDYSLVFEFDEEEAYKLSVPTQRHMVQTFGMLLGVDPPIIPNLDVVRRDILKRYLLLETEELIVGPRSGITYLACALGKPVVEMYGTDRHRRWLSKWSSPMYTMIYGDGIAPEAVSRAIKAMQQRMKEVTNV